MALAIDLRFLPGEEAKTIIRKMARLEAKTQKKFVRQALRKEAKIALKDVNARLARIITRPTPSEHRYREKMKKTKIKSAGRRGLIRIGIAFPTREELGIPAASRSFWPAAFEYGHKNIDGTTTPARPHFRPEIDEKKAQRLGRIAASLKRSVEGEWNKK